MILDKILKNAGLVALGAGIVIAFNFLKPKDFSEYKKVLFELAPNLVTIGVDTDGNGKIDYRKIYKINDVERVVDTLYIEAEPYATVEGELNPEEINPTPTPFSTNNIITNTNKKSNSTNSKPRNSDRSEVCKLY